jgi:hypothetical protein
MLVNLVVGDWSYDGHNQNRTITIESNLSVSEIKEALKTGSEISGIDLNQVCCEYEDNILKREVYDRLIELGMPEDNFYDVEKDMEINIYADEFVYIYLFLVSLGNSKFKYEFPRIEQINIGGYGLFS